MASALRRGFYWDQHNDRLEIQVAGTTVARFKSTAGVAISGEKHSMDVTGGGVVSSGDSLVGLNVTTTPTGSAASWVSGLFVNCTQASKVVNGYICAAEFELTSTAANASDNSVIVLNSVRTHTGSAPVVEPYIMLREYGASGSYANAFVRIFGDTGQGGTTDATTLISTVSDNYEQGCDYAIRCMYGTTPIWILCTSSAAA